MYAPISIPFPFLKGCRQKRVLLTRHIFLPLCMQGKIQGFGSGGPEQSSSSQYGGIGSSNQYGGIGSSSSGSYSGAGGYRQGGGLSGGLPTSFAEAQRAASQLTQVGSVCVGDYGFLRGRGPELCAAVWLVTGVGNVSRRLSTVCGCKLRM